MVFGIITDAIVAIIGLVAIYLLYKNNKESITPPKSIDLDEACKSLID